ncbi:MAG TPA: MauE/DoxX family redox-associated membrane protein [Woeseiaceae bacterium]|nr:MauE/DoxX family redox-associated membrane protein [Woeseiaceae bacterium]
MTFTLDPFYWHLIRWLVAAVFGVALAHKLASFAAFAAVLEDYRLLPSTVVPAAARLVIALEAAVVAGLATGFRLPWAAVLAVLLLAAYGGAIALNLARGRRDIDCGCFGPAAGGRKRQHLSGWLLLRNGVLGGLALLLFLPTGSRELGGLDLAGITAAVATGFLLYAAADQLMANAPHLARSRR